jgi:hypothetical protein
MTKLASPDRQPGARTFSPRLAILARSYWKLGITFVASLAVTLALIYAWTATGDQPMRAHELALRGTISD